MEVSGVLKDFGRDLPFDPKMVAEIQTSSTMRGEQGSDWLSDWGGPQMYREMAYAPVEARVVYYAVSEGNTDLSQIAVVTGLSSQEVNSGISYLERKGLIAVTPTAEETLL